MSEEPETIEQTQPEEPSEETPAEGTPAGEEPAEETPAEETPAEETPAEETPAEEEPAEETPAEEEPEPEPVEETPAEEEPESVVEESVVEETLVEGDLSDDFKKRILELDLLRELCGDWVGCGRSGGKIFLEKWENKSVSLDSSVNYEEKLLELQKMPELIELWLYGKINVEENYFKDIEKYKKMKNIAADTTLERIEALEQLIDLLINCANRNIKTRDILEIITKFY